MIYLLNNFELLNKKTMRYFRTCFCIFIACCGLGRGLDASAQDKYFGEIILIGTDFCPRDTMDADGRQLPINGYPALFSLYSTSYGGNGMTTFNLPDLRGRVPVGVGLSSTGFEAARGQTGGSDSVTLTSSQMPAHTHPLLVGNQPATNASAAQGQILGQAQNAGTYVSGAPSVALSASSIAPTGSANPAPVPVRDPYVGLRWCVVTNGIFPTRP